MSTWTKIALHKIERKPRIGGITASPTRKAINALCAELIENVDQIPQDAEQGLLILKDAKTGFPVLEVAPGLKCFYTGKVVAPLGKRPTVAVDTSQEETGQDDDGKPKYAASELTRFAQMFNAQLRKLDALTTATRFQLLVSPETTKGQRMIYHAPDNVQLAKAKSHDDRQNAIALKMTVKQYRQYRRAQQAEQGVS
jgi:hypothetical protein